jgi:hypothetical protein
LPDLPLATGAGPTAAAASNAASAATAVQRTASTAGGSPPGPSFPLVTPGGANAAARPGTIQREITDAPEAIAQVSNEQSTNTNSEGSENIDLDKINIDELSERVWSRIRRKLRIERERSRGIV